MDAVRSVPAGKALDLACGAGRNAVPLASTGWSVTAVDNSSAALELLLQLAREESAGIDVRQADLEGHEFKIEPESYDLICTIRYLQRDLFAAIRDGLVPGGLFVGEVLLVSSGDAAGAEPAPFRLTPGELKSYFPGWQVLFEQTIDHPTHPTDCLVVRKP